MVETVHTLRQNDKRSGPENNDHRYRIIINNWKEKWKTYSFISYTYRLLRLHFTPVNNKHLSKADLLRHETRKGSNDSRRLEPIARNGEKRWYRWYDTSRTFCLPILNSQFWINRRLRESEKKHVLRSDNGSRRWIQVQNDEPNIKLRGRKNREICSETDTINRNKARHRINENNQTIWPE